MEIEPETLKKGRYYAITLSPALQCGEKKSIATMDKYIKYLMSWIDKLSYCKLVLYPEISAHSRFHYHGVIEILSIVPFLLHDLKSLEQWSNYKIEHFEDYGWLMYIYKMRHIMEPYCMHLGIPYKIEYDQLTKLTESQYIEFCDSKLSIVN